MPDVQPNSPLDWFMNPAPRERCKSTQSVKELSAASKKTTDDMTTLLSVPDAQILSALQKLSVDDLNRLNELTTSAVFRVKPMGQAYYTPPPPPAKPPTELEQHVAHVTRTWALVAKSPLEATGVAFFLKIFEIAPAALGLFSFKDEPDLATSPKMAAHALKVMQTVDVAVKGLADLDKLVPVLQGLGKKHVPYGVIPEHYDIVGQALLATLEAGLGAEWTAAVRDAWVAIYGIIAKTMIGDNYK